MMQSGWRSFLFVPADDDRLFASAISRSSDVVILDLEDGTAPGRKADARSKLGMRISNLKGCGKAAAVRINADLNTAVTDLRACVLPGLELVVLPKVEHARDVQLLSQLVGDLEDGAGIERGCVRFLLQIESCAALPRLHDIAAADRRVMGMMLGSEDFSLDCGGAPTYDLLYVPSMMIVHAARAAGIQPIGFIASIAGLGDEQQFSRTLEQARGLGFRGAVVVHPKFIDAVNDCYTPDEAELRNAREIVRAFEAALSQNKGAVRVGDQMVDKPIYRRAVNLLKEADE